MKQICEICGRTIERPEVSFRLKIEMFADPNPPEITQEDLERDLEAELRKIIEEMANTNPREAEEEVFESYLFTLCGSCRRKIHRRLRGLQLPFEGDW